MSTKINTVLITGSSSGIGLDAAKGFLAHGSNVVLNGRNPEKLTKVAEEMGDASKIAYVAGSVGDKETADKMVDVAMERFGSVDVLVNSAGIFEPKPFLESTEEDLDRFLSNNLKGVFFASQAAIRQMQKQGDGSIINIGTVLISHTMSGLPAAAVLATKGAIHSLTLSLASEFAKDNIRVNAVAPGVIRTPIYGDADVDAFAGVHLLNRVGEVGDTTGAILYLATAGFTTGHILNVDGGFVTGRS